MNENYDSENNREIIWLRRRKEYEGNNFSRWFRN